MRVFVAGASGAIGEPLIAELLKQGHSVVGMTKSEARAKMLEGQSALAAIVDAFDAAVVEAALKRSKPDVVIDELTSLPQEQSDMPKYAAGDTKLRMEGGGNLFRAAIKTGVRRYLQQSSGFFLKAPEGSLADESSPLDVDASPGVAASARTHKELEARLFSSNAIEAVALRYGFFYGPKTWYYPGASAANMVMQQQMPVVGQGQGVSSFVHINDAAMATAAAVTAEAGVYNLVDDDPSPQNVWLPAFANFVGASTPAHISEAEAKMMGGDDAVYYATKLTGARMRRRSGFLGGSPDGWNGCGISDRRPSPRCGRDEPEQVAAAAHFLRKTPIVHRRNRHEPTRKNDKERPLNGIDQTQTSPRSG